MNVLDRLSPGFQAITAQFIAAGLDLPALLAKGPNALKEHIESLKGSGDVAAAVEAATKELQSQLTASQERASLFTAALTAFGATPKAASDGAAITSADIEKALNERASIKASEQLAKHGINKPVGLIPAADPTNPAKKPVASTDADHLAHYESLVPLSKEAREYSAKHHNAIRRADLARLTTRG